MQYITCKNNKIIHVFQILRLLVLHTELILTAARKKTKLRDDNIKFGYTQMNASSKNRSNEK